MTTLTLYSLISAGLIIATLAGGIIVAVLIHIAVSFIKSIVNLWK